MKNSLTNNTLRGMKNYMRYINLFLMIIGMSIGSLNTASATTAAGTYTLQKGAQNSTSLDPGQYVMVIKSTNLYAVPAFAGSGARNIQCSDYQIDSYVTGSYYQRDEVCTLNLDGTEGITEWTITENLGSYKFFDGTYYICGQSSNSNKLLASTSSATAAEWSITHTGSLTYTAATVRNEDDVTYEYCRGNGTILSGYTSSGQGIYFFKKTATLYDINKEPDDDGTASMDTKVGGVSVTQAAEDATVALSQTAKPNYRFDGWIVLDEESNNITVTSNQFTMPASDVWVYPQYTSCGTNATVTAASSESISQTTATVRCADGISSKGDSWCAITEYGFVISAKSANENPEIGGSGVTKHQIGTSYSTLNTAFSKALTGLTASTTYCVRAYATNGHGTAYSPAVHEFTTAAEIVFGNYIISCDDYHNVTYNKNTTDDITGSLPTDDNDYATGATVYVSDGTIGRTGYNFVGWNTDPSASVGITEFTIGSTDAVLYAIWSAIDYTLTMAASPSSMNSYVTAPTTGGNSVTKHKGDAVTITATAAPAHFTFSDWSSSNGGTFADASALSTTFTMPAGNTTVTATYTEEAHYTIVYKEEDDTEIDSEPWYISEDATLQSMSPCTDWRFIGWVTSKIAVETTSKPGTIYTTTYPRAVADATITLYPLYSHMAGGTGDDSDVLPANIAAENGTYTEFSNKAYNSAARYCGKAAKNGDYIMLNSSSNSSYIGTSTSGGNLKSVKLTAKSGAASARNVYIYASNSALNSYSNATSATLVGTITAPNGSDNTQTINLTADYAYVAITSDYAVQIKDVGVTWTTGTLKYATHCSEPTGYTIYYDANGGSTTCTTASNISPATLAAGYTLCGTATKDGNALYKWNTSRDGSGMSYNPTETITSLPATIVTLYAQWRKKVSFDIGANATGSVPDVVDTDNDGSITLPNPSLTIAGGTCDWVLVGWTESALPSTTTEKPSTLLPVNSTYNGSATTLYAVYRRQFANPNAFTLSSLADATKYVGSSSDAVAAGSAVTLYTATRPAGGEYLYFYIDTDVRKYIYYSGSSTTISMTTDASSAYGWNITKVGDNYQFAATNSAGRYYYWNGSGSFNCGTTATSLKKTATTGVYFTYSYLPTCATLVNLSFDAAGGAVNYADGHPEASYKNLPNPTTVSTFPTATPPTGYENWHFIGWYNGELVGNQTEAPATIYDNSHPIDVSTDITLHALFTTYADNVQFDDVNGGEYFIYFYRNDAKYQDDYYSADSHLTRVYAKSPISSNAYNHTLHCSEAQEFNFIPQGGNKWDIKVGTKWLTNTVNNDFDLVNSQPSDKWTVTADGEKWTISYDGNPYNSPNITRLIKANEVNSTTWKFKCYGTDQDESSYYYKVYLGTCEERVYATNPANTPVITFNGEAGIITSSQNGAIRGANVLTVSGSQLAASITISSNSSDIYFSTSASSSFALAAENQPKTEISIAANGSGIVSPTTVYVHYKPSSNVDTWATKTITAASTGAVSQTKDVDLRTVQENFVIASKVGGTWYALPANMSSAGVYEPVAIEVDESSKVAYGPSTVAYKMWPVQTVNGGTDEYASNGDKVRFAGNSNAGLWASNSDNNIRNWSAITAIGSTAETPAAYEWELTTVDRETYTMKSMYSANYLDLYRSTGGGNAGKLIWANNSTYETNEVHFFPLTERTTITIIPREWKSNGFVFMVNADNLISAVTYKIGTGDETSTTYTRHSTGGYGLYEVALPDLTSHYGKTLTLKMTISGVATYATVTIPIIVNANASTKTNEPFATLGAATKDYDVVVLDGKTLTTDAIASGACKFQNLYIYPGATLVNAVNNNLSVRYLELRGGIKGIDHKSDLAQGVPHLKLEKNFSSTAGANLDMSVNVSHSYALSVPFDVTVSSINYVYAYNLNAEGAAINAVLDKHYLLMEYDGAQRASTGKGWKHITSTSRVLHAGEGYVLQAKRPTGQPFAVIRIPFSSVAGWADGSGEVVKSAVDIYEHAGGASTPDNDKGWNLIANPYMATLSYNGADEGWAADFTVGSLVKTDTDPWDGKYQWTSTTNAYVTMPNEWYTEFPQYRANSAQAVFEPFKNFFIQASANGSVTFDKSKRASAPSHLLAQVAKAQPIYADINLTHGEAFAQAGLAIDENATAGYKFGEDQNIFENREALTYLKVYTIADGHYLVGNTLTPAETTEMIPLEFYAPNTIGEYVFSLDEGSDIDRLEYVILYDAELGLNTNLLTGSYAVELDKTGLIENRFSIGLKIKEEEQVTTGTGDVDDETERPFKFIHNDKMYILRNGVLYDATGKRVKEINK